MEFEPMDDFEQKLRDSFERWPAPPDLKRRLMQNRRRRKERPRWFTLSREATVAMALSLGMAVFIAIGGGVASYRAEQQRKGEEARRQVLIALRITNHALVQMNSQLAAHGTREQRENRQ